MKDKEDLRLTIESVLKEAFERHTPYQNVVRELTERVWNAGRVPTSRTALEDEQNQQKPPPRDPIAEHQTWEEMKSDAWLELFTHFCNRDEVLHLAASGEDPQRLVTLALYAMAPAFTEWLREFPSPAEQEARAARQKLAEEQGAMQLNLTPFFTPSEVKKGE